MGIERGVVRQRGERGGAGGWSVRLLARSGPLAAPPGLLRPRAPLPGGGRGLETRGGRGGKAQRGPLGRRLCAAAAGGGAGGGHGHHLPLGLRRARQSAGQGRCRPKQGDLCRVRPPLSQNAKPAYWTAHWGLGCRDMGVDHSVLSLTCTFLSLTLVCARVCGSGALSFIFHLMGGQFACPDYLRLLEQGARQPQAYGRGLELRCGGTQGWKRTASGVEKPRALDAMAVGPGAVGPRKRSDDLVDRLLELQPPRRRDGEHHLFFSMAWSRGRHEWARAGAEWRGLIEGRGRDGAGLVGTGRSSASSSRCHGLMSPIAMRLMWVWQCRG